MNLFICPFDLEIKSSNDCYPSCDLLQCTTGMKLSLFSVQSMTYLPGLLSFSKIWTNLSSTYKQKLTSLVSPSIQDKFDLHFLSMQQLNPSLCFVNICKSERFYNLSSFSSQETCETSCSGTPLTKSDSLFYYKKIRAVRHGAPHLTPKDEEEGGEKPEGYFSHFYKNWGKPAGNCGFSPERTKLKESKKLQILNSRLKCVYIYRYTHTHRGSISCFKSTL